MDDMIRRLETKEKEVLRYKQRFEELKSENGVKFIFMSIPYKP